MRASFSLSWLGALRALVLLAFMARALVPPGYMFAAAGPEAGVKVVVCTAHGMIEAFYDPETGALTDGKSPQKKSSPSDPPCAFGALAKLAPPAAWVAVLAFVPSAEFASTPVFAAPGQGLSAPPPPSTGPPYLRA
jgi:hypothetical protein